MKSATPELSLSETSAPDTHLAPRDPSPENSVVSLIRDAVKNGADPAQLRELLAVRREWEQDEGRKAFNKAIADFQRRAPIIEKADKAYDKQYARMDRIWREIRPLLTELGLSVTWQICEMRADGLCHIEGQLRHRDGHGERLVRDVPMPELIKGQNRAQQAGSASTYAQRYGLTAALGLVTGDDLDDDGHGAGGTLITAEQVNEIKDLVDAARGVANFDENAFIRWLGTDDPAMIPALRFADVKAMLKRKLGSA